MEGANKGGTRQRKTRRRSLQESVKRDNGNATYRKKKRAKHCKTGSDVEPFIDNILTNSEVQTPYTRQKPE